MLGSADSNNIRDDVQKKKLGRRHVLTATEEKVLIDLLSVAAKWGCPFEVRHVQIIVRDYLNSIPRKVPAFERNNNTPQPDWVRSLLKRHPEVKNKFAENIKRSRSAVSREVLRKFYDELTVTMEGVDPRNVVNYDESAFVDDPRRKKVRSVITSYCLLQNRRYQ